MNEYIQYFLANLILILSLYLTVLFSEFKKERKFISVRHKLRNDRKKKARIVRLKVINTFFNFIF